MAFTLVQSGGELQFVDSDGTLSDLTLPTGITLRQDVPPRFIVFERFVVMVNTPSQPLIIDGAGVVRLLSPRAPRVAATLSAVSGGALSGTYAGVRYTFVTKDAVGNLISESDYSLASGSAVLVTQDLKAANLDLSPDAISARRIYRPTTNGSILFQWVELDGNVLTATQDDLSDAGLSLVAAPILGTPPRLTHIAEFRGRLFGVGDNNIDAVRYTEAGIRWAWPADNEIPIAAIGSDNIGVTAMLTRREALGVAREDQLVQIVGSGVETGADIDFEPVTLSKELGILSQESAVVYRDTAYFLWRDGVYQWDSSGIVCISDGVGGKGNVRSWFTTNSYFNRDRFRYAFGGVDPIRGKYRLYLCSPESTTTDRWVEFDLKDRTWWGPHSTTEHTPTSMFMISNASNVEIPIVGSALGDLYQEQSTRTDGDATAIAFNVLSKRHDMQDPDQEKFFGHVTMFGKAQSAGRLGVISRVGELNDTATKPPRVKHHFYNMTQSREVLARAGSGKHLELELTHSTIGEEVELYAYEVVPVHGIGTR